MKLLLSAALLLSSLSLGCNRSDGDRLARVGVKVADKVQALAPERTPFAGALASQQPAVDIRVKERFRLDRYLAVLTIEVTADGGAVRLRGRVDDPVLKQRALEIAESTVGVDTVVDEIAVGK